MAYFVYILYSEKTDNYYVGSTSDIEKRLQKHNLGGTASTCPGRPWRIVYSEILNTKHEALIHINDHYYTIIDSTYNFLEYNKVIPKYIINRSVLIDQKDKIRMIGEPWINKKMTKLFISICNK